MAAAAGAPQPPLPPGPFSRIPQGQADEDLNGEDYDSDETVKGPNGQHGAPNNHAGFVQRPIPAEWTTYDSDDDPIALIFKCSFCPKGKPPFTRRNNLRKHQRLVHLRPRRSLRQYWDIRVPQRRAKREAIRRSDLNLAVQKQQQRLSRRQQKTHQQMQNRQQMPVALASQQNSLPPAGNYLQNLRQNQENLFQEPVRHANIRQQMPSHHAIPLLAGRPSGLEWMNHQNNLLRRANAAALGDVLTGTINPGQQVPLPSMDSYPGAQFGHNENSVDVETFGFNHLTLDSAQGPSQQDPLRPDRQLGNHSQLHHDGRSARGNHPTQGNQVNEGNNVGAVVYKHLGLNYPNGLGNLYRLDNQFGFTSPYGLGSQNGFINPYVLDNQQGVNNPDGLGNQHGFANPDGLGNQYGVYNQSSQAKVYDNGYGQASGYGQNREYGQGRDQQHGSDADEEEELGDELDQALRREARWKNHARK